MVNTFFKKIIIPVLLILLITFLQQKMFALEYKKEKELSFNWGKGTGEIGLLVEEHEVDNIIYWGPGNRGKVSTIDIFFLNGELGHKRYIVYILIVNVLPALILLQLLLQEG